MSFLVAVRPASAFSLKKPFFSSRVRARASLVVSLGRPPSPCPALPQRKPPQKKRQCWKQQSGAVEEEPPQAVRAAAAAATPVTFRKSRRVIISLSLSIIGYKCLSARRGTVRARLNGSIKKASVLPAMSPAQGRRPENFRGTTLFYRTLTGHGLEAAAVGAELGSHGVQPDALTGVPVAGLALLCFAHAAPRPFSVPCFLPFSTVRALW